MQDSAWEDVNFLLNASHDTLSDLEVTLEGIDDDEARKILAAVTTAREGLPLPV